MRRKISNAPAPIRPLPPGHAEPEAAAKARTKQLAKATPVAAQRFHEKFFRAIRNRDRTNAKFYADQCKAEGLPDPWLTEVFHLRDRLLDEQQASIPAQKRKTGPKTTVRKDLEEAMRKDLRNGVIGPDEKIEQLAKRYESKNTSTLEAYNKVRAEFIGNSKF
jgi:hypothetical protein